MSSSSNSLDLTSVLADPPSSTPPADLTRLPSAHLRRFTPPGERGRLVSVYGDSVVLVKFGSKDEKEKEEQLQQLIQEVWKKAKENLPPSATRLCVHLSQPTVIITYFDEERNQTLRMNKDRSDAEFYDLVKKAKELSRQLFNRVYFPNEDSNRASMGQSHLEISSKRWKEKQPHSLSEYLGKNKLGFGQLEEKLSDNAKEDALDRIIAAEGFIQGMQIDIEKLIKLCEEKKNRRDIQKEDRKAIEREIENLRLLHSKFQRLDRHAVFTAVGIWGGTVLNADLATRLGMADKLSKTMAIILTTKLSQGELRPHIHEYSREAGDLFLHDKLEQLGRADEDDRIVKAASVEEFVVHSMIHLGHNLNAIEAIRALGIRFDPGTSQLLEGAVQRNLTEAEKVRSSMSGVHAGTWQGRVKAAKKQKIL